MRIVIFDLKFTNYIYHSTPSPSMETILISGYYKSKGAQVIFSDTIPDFGVYDKVYIVKDAPNLFHHPEWLSYTNVYPVGRYWEGIEPTYDIDWESGMPDINIYQNWVENWIKKYPSYNPKRLNSFFRRPVKLKQGNKITAPEGDNLLIIDNDLHIWDKECKVLSELNVKSMKLLYPMILDGRWEEALKCFSLKHIYRGDFWAEMNFEYYDEEKIKEVIEIFNKYKPGRLFRIKCHVSGQSNQEWVELIPRIYKLLEDFRMDAGKRIFIEPHGIENFQFPRILQELKRWTGKDMGYTKNSLFDYMVFDGCRDVFKMAEFFQDPYDYLEKKKHGKNKFIELIPFIETYPELMDVITKSYGKAGW